MWWVKYAWCRNYDPEIFFPIATEESVLGFIQREDAKEICALCPVRRECLAWALKTKQDHGVWGGLSESERILLISTVSR